LIILITGPESSGKTTLAKALAESLEFELLPEYARTYLCENGSDYVYNDLRQIALEHVSQFEKLQESKQDICLDTYLLNLHIWAQYKFQKVDAYIEQQLDLFRPDLTLLLKPDLDWEPDPLRENKNNRDRLFELFESKLKARNDKYVVIEGNQRLEQAEAAVRIGVIGKIG